MKHVLSLRVTLRRANEALAAQGAAGRLERGNGYPKRFVAELEFEINGLERESPILDAHLRDWSSEVPQ